MTSITGNSRRARGLTLVEILTVIVILGILASLTIGVTVAVKKQAQKKATLNLLERISMALEDYHKDYNYYPPDAYAPPTFPADCTVLRYRRLISPGTVITELSTDGRLRGAMAMLWCMGKGRYVCTDCGFAYSRALEDKQPFGALSDSWAHPDVGHGSHAKDRFADAKDYLEHVDWKNVGQGVIKFDDDYDESTPKIDLNVSGVLVDSWGKPIFYDNLSTTGVDGANGMNRPSDEQYISIVRDGYVIFSTGPD